MGIVYEALQLSLRRKVALKVLPFASTLQTRQLQRFVNEAQAAAHLHHPNIVPVFAVGKERGVHYYAMQFIDGLSLAEMLERLRRDAGLGDDNHSAPTTEGYHSHLSSSFTRPPDRSAMHRAVPDTVQRISTQLSDWKSRDADDFFRAIAQWVRQAADGLAYAHDLGIVHRDIKPANLMLDGTGRVWVTDFGLAQIRSGGDLTQTGDLVGTLRYMSPEQANGDRQLLDHRTDIYSLGATLYELATLRPIYDNRNKEGLLHDVVRGEPPAPRAVNRRIPVELENIITQVDQYVASGSLRLRAGTGGRFTTLLGGPACLGEAFIATGTGSPMAETASWSDRRRDVIAGFGLHRLADP